MFEDGTNVRIGTKFITTISQTDDWYRPADAKSSVNWQKEWTELRARIANVVDECRPIECILIQKRVPGFRQDSLEYNSVMPNQLNLLQMGGGLSREMSQLFTEDLHPLFGSFPISDATGRPICNSAGEPFGLEFGLFRQYFLAKSPAHDGEPRSFPGARLTELTRDGAHCLYGLPPRVAASIWRNWQRGFSRRSNSDEYHWLDALFELSWQGQSGDGLHTERYAWNGDTSIRLEGSGLFPRLPNLEWPDVGSAVLHENGYPLAHYAEIPDIARASVKAIDIILERANEQAPSLLGRDQVFVSYSHKDTRFLNDFLAHLKPYVRSSSIAAWSDKEIAPGSEWLDEIRTAISRARVAVLLVTKDFLASDFIDREELGPLLKLAESGGVTILWVLVRACSYSETPLKNYQAVVSPPAKPLAEMKAERDGAWVRVCQAIKNAVQH